MGPKFKNVLNCAGKLRVHLVPKCATSSITRAVKLNPIHSAFPEEEGPEHRFMCVRHPLDRIVSFWAFFIAQGGERLNSNGIGALGYWKNMPFEKCLEHMLQNDTYTMNHHSQPQVLMAGPHEIHQLVRLENLTEEWDKLTKQFEKIHPIGFFHRTDHDQWHTYYKDLSLKKQAEEVFSKDIELYERAI